MIESLIRYLKVLEMQIHFKYLALGIQIKNSPTKRQEREDKE
jgi:hypothetical protein